MTLIIIKKNRIKCENIQQKGKCQKVRLKDHLGNMIFYKPSQTYISFTTPRYCIQFISLHY